MIFSWFISIYLWVLTYPERLEEVEERTRFVCEVILNDEGFFSDEVYENFDTEIIKRFYNIAFLGAKFLAWKSLEHNDWRDFIYNELYKKGGMCENINSLIHNKKVNFNHAFSRIFK